MSNFVVSARKYRPVRFDEVVGQQHVSQTLKNALQQDHLAHAFLFCGPRGVGKTTCARILAKVLNCQQVGQDFEPCNTCDSCRSFNENASFNITELDAASNNSVEHIRSLIEQVRFQPQQGRYKIFIIDEVHMLSTQAFNAFLKTLEEPPPYAIFILATTEKHKIIPTILSRCQIFDFKRIQVGDMVSHLEEICRQEGIEADRDALHIIAQKADGALRDSLSIFDRIVSFSGKKVTYDDVIANLNVLDYDYYFRFVDALLREDVSEVLLVFDEILRKGFDGDLFIDGLSEHLRNLLVCQDPETVALLEVSEGLQARYFEQATLAPPAFVLSALEVANVCDLNYKMARNKRLHVELALIRMTYLNRAVQAPALAEMAEKKRPEGSSVPVRTKVEEPATPKETPPSVEEPEKVSPKEEPAPPQTGKLKRSAKFDVPRVSTSLEALEAEVSEEEGQQVKSPHELKLEEIQEVWNNYAAEIPSDSLRSVLQSTDLSVEKGKLVAVVGSSFAENTLLQELELMEHLRRELRTPDLIREVRIDPGKQKAQAPPPKKKPLSPKEKYLELKEKNPLIAKMKERFDLSPDED